MASTAPVDPARQAAALVLQKAFRDFRVRFNRASTLPDSLVQEVSRRHFQQPLSSQRLPRAPFGKTPVYLPPDLPVVIKVSGTQAPNRLKCMQEARRVLWKNGFQHLIIPQASCMGASPTEQCLIEQCLPISPHDIKRSIGFYLQNREEASTAIAEFTRFLCQSVLPDITGNTTSPYARWYYNMPRYDNVTLYRDPQDHTLKIALVDLEGYAPLNKKYTKDYRSVLHTLISLFPRHLECILETVKQLDPDIDRCRKELLDEQKRALSFFEQAYLCHERFIHENHLTAEQAGKLLPIPADIEQQLAKAAVATLTTSHQDKGWFFQGCLGKDPEITLQTIRDNFPAFLGKLRALIEGILEHNYNTYQISKDSPIEALVACRTLSLPRTAQKGTAYAFFINAIIPLFPLSLTHQKDTQELLSEMTKSVLTEMARLGLLCYYDKSFGFGEHAVQGLFC